MEDISSPQLDRGPIREVDWKAYAMTRLLELGDPESLDWWPNFERAYLTYPDENFQNLVNRLSDYDSNFRGAVWEMYLWLQLADAKNQIQFEHPINESARSGDFLVQNISGRKYFLEATTISSGAEIERTLRRESQIQDAVMTRLWGSGFYITASVTDTRDCDPDVEKFVEDAQEWIDSVAIRDDESSTHTFRSCQQSGWTIEFTIRHLQSLGTSHQNAFMGSNKKIDFVDLLRAGLQLKLDKKFESDPGIPCVLAVAEARPWWTSDLFNRFSALIARPAIQFDRLTGSTRNALIDYGPQIANNIFPSRISAVIFGDGEFPGFSSRSKPDIWLNERAKYPLDSSDFDFPAVFHVVRHDGIYERTDSHSSNWARIGIPGIE